MRLRDIQHILKEQLPALSFPASAPQNRPAGTVRSFHRHRLERALRALKAVEPLREGAESALNHHALKEVGEPTMVLEEIYSDFQRGHINPLASRGNDLLEVIDSILPEEDPLSFAYRIPDAVTDLKTLDAELGVLKLVFDEPLARLTGERAKVEALDRGSLIVELVAGTTAGVWIVALLCRAAKTLMDTRHQFRTQELQYDSLMLDVEHKGNIVKANKVALDHVARRLAEGITAKTDKAGDNEAANLVQVAVQKLAGEFERGAAVLLAQGAPAEAKELMPKPEDPPLLPEAVIKELLAVNPPPAADADATAGEGGNEEPAAKES